MSEKRLTGHEGSSTQARETLVIVDALRDNAIKIVDEAVKTQPQLAHSMSNFYLDNIKTAKSLIESSFASQRQVWSTPNNPQFLQQLSEQIAEQSIEITTNNSIRSANIFNALGVNMLDLTRENLKIYNRTIDAATGYNSAVLNTWSYYWPSFAQQ